MDQLLTVDECKAIAHSYTEIVGTDDITGVEHRIRWQRMKPDEVLKNPAYNQSGVSGDCIFDGIPGTRVHICANMTCMARHKHPSKYGDTGPPKAHLRIRRAETDPPRDYVVLDI